MTGNTVPCREKPDFQGYLENQLTLPERHRFERHIKDCRACNRALEEYRRLFAGLDDACAPMQRDLPGAGSIDQVMKRLPTMEKTQPIPFWQALSWPLAVALAVLVLVALPFTLTYVKRPPSEARPFVQSELPAMAAMPRYSYSFLPVPGKPGAIEKSGGTALPAQGDIEPGAAYRLPPEGTLFVEFSGANRLEFTHAAQFSAVASGITLLSGQVLCDLQPQATGFLVTTPAGSIAVRGTRFSVEVTQRGTEVRLDRGAIELQTPRQRERLAVPGTRLMTTDGAILSPSAPPTGVSAGPLGQSPDPVPSAGTHTGSTRTDTGNAAGTLNQGF